MLDAIWNDRRTVFPVNLPNGGAAPDLPEDAVLELPAVATATGLRPLQMTDFLPPLTEIIARKVDATGLTVEAALAGDRDLFVEALLADGAVAEPETALKMAEEMLEAHRPLLPNFFPEA